VRLEIGPKDIEQQQVVLVRRDTRAKQPTPMSGLTAQVQALLETIQQDLLDRATTFRSEHTSAADTYDEFRQLMEGRPGFVNAPWCGDEACEAAIKADTQATIRNLPFTDEPSARCVRCDKPAITRARFAKAY
jgi:prolyl-tRNA synthetase